MSITTTVLRSRVVEALASPHGVDRYLEIAADPQTGDIHLVKGPHFRGIQFHAESILTENGFDILRDLVTDLVG